MDVTELDKISFCGQTLNVEERAALEVGMKQRRLEEDLQDMYFWGRITGIEADYLICYGLVLTTDYPQKRFFFCTSKNLELKAFPELSEEFQAKAAADKGKFSGDSTKLPEGEEEDEEDADEENPAPKPVRYREQHRLAYVVQQIDSACSLVPRGAFIVNATHYVVRNAAFSGLPISEACSNEHYYHFREPKSLPRKSVLERRGLVEASDFLDPISEDEPNGIWVIRLDEGAGEVNIRSLLYPGYFFYHKYTRGQYGGAYFGDGQINKDLGFML